MRKTVLAAVAAVGMASVASPASAALLTGTFAVTASTGLNNGSGFDVTTGNPYSGANTASATFFYTGPINFFNNAPQSNGATGDLNSAFGFSSANVTGYAGTGNVVFNGNTVATFAGSLGRFLASSGSSSNYEYGSYYTFDLGQILAGTVITITHDDGAAFYQGATKIGNTVTGPTGQSTTTFTVGSTGNTTLRYSRQNGTPSILVVDAVAPVPEPATWAMLILGFGVVGSAMRRRKTAVRVAFA